MKNKKKPRILINYKMNFRKLTTQHFPQLSPQIKKKLKLNLET